MPITSTCSMPSTSASHRLVRPGRSACTSAITGIQPEPVGQLGGVVAPERVVAGEEPARPRRGRAGRAGRRGRRRRSRSRRPSTRAIGGAASVAAARISSTTSPGVGEAGEHHLVGAGREGDAAVEHGVEEGGVARGVGALRARRSRPGASAQKKRPTRLSTCGTTAVMPARSKRRAEAGGEPLGGGGERGVGRRVEEVERGQPGGGGERVPGQRAGLVHGAERRDLLHHVAAAAVGADVEAAADHLAEGREVGRDAVASPARRRRRRGTR